MQSKKDKIGWMLVALAVMFLTGMGVWQLQRLAWKENMIAHYEQASALPPEPVQSVVPEQYRRVLLRGVWLPGVELHLGGRRWRGQTGYQILTPMVMAGTGRTYLVNRGWVPTDLKEPESRKESLPEEEVEIMGMIRLPEEPGIFTPKNHPEKNFWFTADIPAMEEITGLKLEPLVVEIQAADDAPRTAEYPVPAGYAPVFRNDHLGYAITWFLLAAAAGVIGWLRLKRP